MIAGRCVGSGSRCLRSRRHRPSQIHGNLALIGFKIMSERRSPSGSSVANRSESNRVSWRLIPLRGLSHDKEHPLLPGAA